MIAVIDYGGSNLKSVYKALQYLESPCQITQDPKDIVKADKLIFPGQGAFGDCVKNLKAHDLDETIKTFMGSGKPFLGICLGLQTLFDTSSEGGSHIGFGIVPGNVVRFEHGLKIPHMGWNQIQFDPERASQCPLLEGINDGAFMYFVHSYFVIPKQSEVTVTKTEYGLPFTSMIWKDNIYAVQFHPEKSQKDGLRLLNNFIQLNGVHG